MGPAVRQAISIDNHLAWFEAVRSWPILKTHLDPLKQSSILYDLVAVYLGFRR